MTEQMFREANQLVQGHTASKQIQNNSLCPYTLCCIFTYFLQVELLGIENVFKILEILNMLQERGQDILL